jgi:hypothetical protein
MTKAQMIRVNGRPLISNTGIFHFETMAHAGWVKITSCGSENLYFIFKDDAGKEQSGYCKCL